MNSRESMLDRIQTTAPCSADWAAMSGNEEVRFCRHCDLSVYNLSSMGRKEAEALVAQSNGRLCARYFRRRDGSIVTADEPGNLSAVNARVIAGAFTVLLTISANARGQSAPRQGSQASQLELSVKKDDASGAGQAASIKGSITDPNEALIPNAKLTLINESKSGSLKTTSDQAGEFQFVSLPTGVYSLTVEAAGFSTFAVQRLKLASGDELRVDARMQIGTPVCEIVEIQGSNATIGLVAMSYNKRSFWRILLDVVSFPYRQGKRLITP